MTLNEYQTKALVTRGPTSTGLFYPALGLAGEVGEWYASGDILEAGDVMWYVAALADEIDAKLDDLEETGEFSPCSAAGRVCEQVKRIIRDDRGELTPARLEKIRHALADVVSSVRRTLGPVRFEEALRLNLRKLADRAMRGKLKGEGDAR